MIAIFQFITHLKVWKFIMKPWKWSAHHFLSTCESCKVSPMVLKSTSTRYQVIFNEENFMCVNFLLVVFVSPWRNIAECSEAEKFGQRTNWMFNSVRQWARWGLLTFDHWMILLDFTAWKFSLGDFRAHWRFISWEFEYILHGGRTYYFREARRQVRR